MLLTTGEQQVDTRAVHLAALYASSSSVKKTMRRSSTLHFFALPNTLPVTTDVSFPAVIPQLPMLQGVSGKISSTRPQLLHSDSLSNLIEVRNDYDSAEVIGR